MGKVTANTYSEVYSYLNVLGDDFIKKVPLKLYKKIKEMKNNEYNPEYNFEDFENKSKISKEAQVMIMVFHYKYWCDTDDEKKEIANILKENEKKFVEAYDPFKKFKNQKNYSTEDKPQSLVVQKKSFIKRILEKIMARFKKNNI